MKFKIKREIPPKRKRIYTIIKICILTAAIIYVLTGLNNNPRALIYTIESDKIDKGIRFALVSDLHSSYYGENQSQITDIIDNYSPDAVLLTGDIFDEDLPEDNSWIFLEYIASKYDCYYVTGNHEEWSGKCDEYKNGVSKLGITVLSDDIIETVINDNRISLIGMNDPAYSSNAQVINKLNKLNDSKDDEIYSVLLSHRPNYAVFYKEKDFDLIVSGHMHGGQWRVPGIINGLYAPGHFLFPKYCGGLYHLNDVTNMVVSRGLALDSTPVPRLHNRPEVVFIDLK